MLLGRIETIDPRVGAFRQVIAEEALTVARAQTEELANGQRRGPLHGVPVAVKELFDVAGTTGCYGSEIFMDRISEQDAVAVRRLRDAGAIVIGTTRSHEFGWGITNQNDRLGNTYNPWDTSRVPGGSSGGSAAAVALGMVPLALGSDTGGSIRIPACFCGVAGLKPTYGRVSKRGAIALAPSLDHPGPLARSVPDLALGLAAIAGHDPDDPTTFAAPPPNGAVPAALKGVRVGVSPDLHVTPLRPDHQLRFDAALGTISGAGGVVVESSMPGADAIRPTFASIQMAEAHHVHSVTLGTFPERADEYGADVRRRLEMASEVDVGDYISARQDALVVKRRFADIFEEVDVLLTPVTAGGPSTVERPDVSPHQDDPMPFRDLVMDYTVPQDLAGLPACAVVNGFDDDGMPVGIQFTAPERQEERVLAVAAGFAEALGSEAHWPSLALE